MSVSIEMLIETLGNATHFRMSIWLARGPGVCLGWAIYSADSQSLQANDGIISKIGHGRFLSLIGSSYPFHHNHSSLHRPWSSNSLQINQQNYPSHSGNYQELCRLLKVSWRFGETRCLHIKRQKIRQTRNQCEAGIKQSSATCPLSEEMFSFYFMKWRSE